MKLTPLQGHLVVFLVAVSIAMTVHVFVGGYGYYSFGPMHLNRSGAADVAAFLSFGLYYRYCHAPIAPNTQGVQVFLGTQTGVVWDEGNFHFIPRPLWDIWKEESVQHIVFTVAAQNRSSEGHQMIVMATGRGIPTNAFAMAKLVSRDDLVTQLVGLSMQTIAAYIHREPREVLLGFPSFDLSQWFIQDHQNSTFNSYGVQVDLRTTKVVEVNPRTMEQFDVLARTRDMATVVEALRLSFPHASDVERYAIYATMVGIQPAVMSYIIQGGTGNLLIDGRSPS